MWFATTESIVVGQNEFCFFVSCRFKSSLIDFGLHEYSVSEIVSSAMIQAISVCATIFFALFFNFLFLFWGMRGGYSSFL